MIAVSAVAVVLVGGCGGGGGGGTTSVPLPVAKSALLDKYRTQLEGSGVPPQVAQCYADKIRGLSNAEFKRFLAESGQANLPPDLIRLNAQLHAECVGTTGQAVNPNASSAQIQHSRQLLAHSIAALVKSQGATPSQIACMTGKVNALPDSEIVKISNDPAEARSVLRPMAQQCGGG